MYLLISSFLDKKSGLWKPDGAKGECGNKVEMRTLFPNCKTSSSWSTIVQNQATIGKEVVSSAFVRIKVIESKKL